MPRMTKADLLSYYGQKLGISGYKEAIRQPLYDSVLYAAAGQVQLNLFSLPIGGGTALTGSGTKTIQDTNLAQAGQIPQGQKFVIESIELHFFPGSVSTANTYTPVKPMAQATSAAAVNGANDVYTFLQAGHFNLTIGSKPLLDESPLMVFPPKTGLFSPEALAVATTATSVTQQLSFDYARGVGRPYDLDPVIPLAGGDSIVCSLSWPAALALPSGFNGKVMCRFDGILFRN